MHTLVFLAIAAVSAASVSSADFASTNAPPAVVRVTPSHVEGDVDTDTAAKSGITLVASLHEARDVARRTGARTIELLPGIHSLSEPLVFDHPEDSGVTWTTSGAESAGSASISGGVAINDWHR